MVKSKFSFISVYLAFAVICGFIFMTIAALFVLGFHQSSSMLIFGAGAVFAGIFLVKKMIVIKVFPDRIELKGLLFRQTIFRDDILSIEFAGREQAGLMGAKWPSASVVVQWGRGDRIILVDAFYRNMPQVKQALHAYFLSSSDTAEAVPEMAGGEPVPAGIEAAAETFAGNALLNVQTILFLVYLVMIAFALHPIKEFSGSLAYLLILAAVTTPIYVMVGFRLYYFKVSDEYLIVKNHFFPWTTKGYPLKDITDVAVESSLLRIPGLRISTRGFFSKRYGAGSLKRTDWIAMKESLERANIPVKTGLP